MCPGQDLVYNCTLTDVPSAAVVWIYSNEQGELVTLMQLTTVGNSENLGPFSIIVLQRTFTPTINAVSTATLNNALLSHNNTNIACTAVGNTDGSAAATILISGNHFH